MSNRMDLIRQGVKEQAEALAEKNQQNKQEEKVTDINLSGSEDNGISSMTTQQKDAHILKLTEAVNELTEKLNGGADNE